MVSHTKIHVEPKRGIFHLGPIDTVMLLIIVGIVIRLVFMGILNLLPEEAYYWNYAKYLDIGYLDHPPMVAWLNYISEAVFGHNEFAVRLPAFLGWFVMAYFMYRLADRTAGRGAGKIVLLLLAVLPIYFSVGFLMTPDAPFYACWAGALYFLARALLDNETRAWYGAEIFLGLGLLSKYTMGLIIPATVVFMLLDRDARRLLLKSHPYTAVLIGLIIFSPVIYWNAEHQWISFAFQGERRWSGGINFQLHILIGSILVLLSPLGFYEAARVIWDFGKHRISLRQTDNPGYRRYLFLVVFCIVPLLVFVFHSMQGQPKLNWTGPVWMSLLPLIAARILGMKIWRGELGSGKLARSWLITVWLLVIFFVAGFSYMVAGMPGVKKENGLKFPIAWRAYGKRVAEIEARMENGTNTRPILIGLDKYWLASQASFYDFDAGTDDADAPAVGGENLVGSNGLMWKSWVSPEMITGRNSLLVSFDRDKLTLSRVIDRFERVGEINKELLTGHYGEIGHFYWRIGYNYQPK